MAFFWALPPRVPSPCPALPVLASRLRLLLREPALLRLPVPPFMFVALGGCFEPEGARITPLAGDGEDCDDRAPFIDVWTAGGGGRFSFW